MITNKVTLFSLNKKVLAQNVRNDQGILNEFDSKFLRLKRDNGKINKEIS